MICSSAGCWQFAFYQVAGKWYCEDCYAAMRAKADMTGAGSASAKPAATDPAPFGWPWLGGGKAP